jgi:hypothetical protein
LISQLEVNNGIILEDESAYIYLDSLSKQQASQKVQIGDFVHLLGNLAIDNDGRRFIKVGKSMLFSSSIVGFRVITDINKQLAAKARLLEIYANVYNSNSASAVELDSTKYSFSDSPFQFSPFKSQQPQAQAKQADDSIDEFDEMDDFDLPDPGLINLLTRRLGEIVQSLIMSSLSSGKGVTLQELVKELSSLGEDLVNEGIENLQEECAIYSKENKVCDDSLIF